jgi:hypothetical protein
MNKISDEIKSYLLYSSTRLFLCIMILEIVRKKKIFLKLHIGQFKESGKITQ